ncbi:MAG: flagellar basal body P-ring formation chaperone FlgA [Rhizomicrobium sp.]|nr:flagellar basal body P-ring formation chaperone FlgA [Rhizomicrobium sp.]
MMKKWLLAFALLSVVPAFGGVRVVVPSHDVARGSVIGAADLTYAIVATTVMGGVATSASEVVGLETRRTLHAGETLRVQDLRRPVLIARGSTVTMTFEAPGIVLTSSGRAITEGGLGDTVTIQNPASFRQITGVVIGPGQVRAEAGAARLASIDP